ncbi:MAG TPA: glycosyltransferase family 39 protein, partial [Gemmatimonadaceae bacterium]|nr:glycosyltransferase family 39 protein [Gemmatimonadaceae bacterium]
MSSTPDVAGSGARLLPLLVCGAALATALAMTGDVPVGAFYDDGIYVVLAKALATGEGYRYLNLPGEPTATHFPPGYPAFLAVLWKLAPRFPENVGLFRLANALLLAAVAGGTYAIARLRLHLSLNASALTAVIATVSVPLLTVTVMLLSEPLFLALALPVLLLAERAVEEGRVPRAALAGVLGGVVTLVRSLGIGILPATVFLLLVRRRWAAAGACALGGLAVVLPWQRFAAAHAAEVPALFTGQYGAYTAWALAPIREHGLGFVADVVAVNARQGVGFFRALFAAHLPAGAAVMLLAALALVAVMGVRAVSRRAPVTALFILSYLAIVAVWPFHPGRFLWGIWPLLWLVLAAGVASLWRWRPAPVPARAARMALFAGAAALLVG